MHALTAFAPLGSDDRRSAVFAWRQELLDERRGVVLRAARTGVSNWPDRAASSPRPAKDCYTLASVAAATAERPRRCAPRRSKAMYGTRH
jgi:hypothetical protein